jgi:hypothetical protein
VGSLGLYPVADRVNREGVAAYPTRRAKFAVRVSVRAHSIRRAISLVRSSYPGAEASLVLPVDPESFFLGDDFDGTEQETFRMPERLLVG